MRMTPLLPCRGLASPCAWVSGSRIGVRHDSQPPQLDVQHIAALRPRQTPQAVNLRSSLTGLLTTVLMFLIAPPLEAH